ncbi:short chain dehydrogenase family protein [Mycobacterium xenopi 4042]|uniref:Short chain dehydrogenase family protein n=1 Tax=Mycobacterium xenopi 4042 TaxID=1299334 RepID=X8AEZ4_MYCXE|nr:short chain dehydrogenase family protein [Mycobacterium xenopi 4042]
MIRQKILITGASSGLGAGMARQFAAKGRDLALCARRTDRLDELKTELTQQHPNSTVAVAALDVNDHEQVPKVFAELSDTLGGIDRIIVNAGIGKGRRWARASCGPTRRPSRPTWWPPWFRSKPRWRCSNRPVRDTWCSSRRCSAPKECPASRPPTPPAKPASARWGIAARRIRGWSDQGVGDRAGYIESEMTAKSESTLFMVDNETGVRALVNAIEREPGRAAVPWWPWAPLVQLMRVLPPRMTKYLA